MDIFSIILISVSLAMDAFAVSICSGVSLDKKVISTAFFIGFLFGAFQALMPVLGWLGGTQFAEFIEDIDHWIAFGLLCVIGGKMILSAFKTKDCDDKVDKKNNLRFIVLLGLAVATSIDALAVGVVFAFQDVSILLPVIIIGLITFVLSFIGVLIGKKCYSILEGKIEIIGGIILISIGIKILIEDLAA